MTAENVSVYSSLDVLVGSTRSRLRVVDDHGRTQEHVLFPITIGQGGHTIFTGYFLLYTSVRGWRRAMKGRYPPLPFVGSVYAQSSCPFRAKGGSIARTAYRRGSYDLPPAEPSEGRPSRQIYGYRIRSSLQVRDMRWGTAGEAVIGQNKCRQRFGHGMRTERHSLSSRHCLPYRSSGQGSEKKVIAFLRSHS